MQLGGGRTSHISKEITTEGGDQKPKFYKMKYLTTVKGEEIKEENTGT